MLECMDRLDAAIRAAREIVAEDFKEAPLAEIIALARKITPSTRPPPGILFSIDQGPAEALPIRFRLPYPTLDEMKASLVATEGNKLVGTVRPEPVTQPIIQDAAVDDYEDDF